MARQNKIVQYITEVTTLFVLWSYMLNLVLSQGGDICSMSDWSINDAKIGVLYSPNYPNDYPNEQNCTVTLTSQTHLTFVIYDFELENNNNGTCVDGLSFTANGNNVTICNSYAVFPQHYKPETNHVVVTFYSDSNYNIYRGFFLLYRTVESDPYELCKSSAASNGSYGAVTSPSYPKDYPKNTTCSFTIPDSSKELNITTWLVDIKNGDSVEILSNGLLVDNLTSSNSSVSYVTGGNVTVTFSSNSDDTVGKGFILTYMPIAPATTLQVTTTEQATSTSAPATTSQETTTEQVTSTSAPATTAQVTTTEQATSTSATATTSQVTITEQATSTSAPGTSSQATTTEQATSTSAPATTLSPVTTTVQATIMSTPTLQEMSSTGPAITTIGTTVTDGENTAQAIGGAVGGTAILAVLVILLIFILRRRSKKPSRNDMEKSTFALTNAIYNDQDTGVIPGNSDGGNSALHPNYSDNLDDLYAKPQKKQKNNEIKHIEDLYAKSEKKKRGAPQGEHVEDLYTKPQKKKRGNQTEQTSYETQAQIGNDYNKASGSIANKHDNSTDYKGIYVDVDQIHSNDKASEEEVDMIVNDLYSASGDDLSDNSEQMDMIDNDIYAGY